jgi:hypothetical protein
MSGLKSRSVLDAAVSLLLLVALLGFTTVYRNSPYYSFSNATRCRSISTETRLVDAGVADRTVLLGIGPEEVPPLPAAVPCGFAVASPFAAPPIALTVSPLRRPPPTTN